VTTRATLCIRICTLVVFFLLASLLWSQQASHHFNPVRSQATSQVACPVASRHANQVVSRPASQATHLENPAANPACSLVLILLANPVVCRVVSPVGNPVVPLQFNLHLYRRPNRPVSLLHGHRRRLPLLLPGNRHVAPLANRLHLLPAHLRNHLVSHHLNPQVSLIPNLTLMSALLNVTRNVSLSILNGR
jgi:hypothetical protein